MSVIIYSLFFGLFIGLALSVDAFVLSLVYGLTIKRRRDAFFTALTVGLFHFIMPLIGFLLTRFLFNTVHSLALFQRQFNQIGSFILLLLGVLMLFKESEETRHNFKHFFNILLFAFSVSLDAFFIGIALSTNNTFNTLIIISMFLMISTIITYLGLRLIHRSQKVIAIKKLNIIAGLTFILFGILSFFIH